MHVIYRLCLAVTQCVNHSSVVSLLCADIRCPFCSKPFPGGRIEDHLLSCLTSPPLPYNSKYCVTETALTAVFFNRLEKLTVAFCVSVFTADVLSKDSGECSICLEDLVQGETIARLACLCVYHKR